MNCYAMMTVFEILFVYRYTICLSPLKNLNSMEGQRSSLVHYYIFRDLNSPWHKVGALGLLTS